MDGSDLSCLDYLGSLLPSRCQFAIDIAIRKLIATAMFGCGTRGLFHMSMVLCGHI